jgi:uncharacterized protein YecE (DUF72 family)
LEKTNKKLVPRRVRIGISGWTYAPWRGVFYPKGLARKNELAFAATQFNTIEVNGTHYSLQRPESFAAWKAATPDDFVFAVKGSRYITHMLRLHDTEVALANFLASGVLKLGRKLGPLLWQLPPNFQFDAQRIGTFLACLPRDTDAASALARRHDQRLAGRAAVEADEPQRIRHALEVRHHSFMTGEFIDLLRRHDVALVCADTVSWPRMGDVTSDLIYCRLHGSEELYASGYDAGAIADWAKRVETWAAGGTPKDLDRCGSVAPRRKRDVFVYFDNDIKVRAPGDAAALEAALK